MSKLQKLLISKQSLVSPKGMVVSVPTRNRWFKKGGDGSLPNRSGKYRRDGKIPANWRTVNWNIPQIPSAWKPPNYDATQTIDYEREQELAKYIPGYQPKIPPHLHEDFHEEGLYQMKADTITCDGIDQLLNLTKCVIMPELLPPAVQQQVSTQEDCDVTNEQVIKIIQHAHLFDVDPRNSDKERAHKIRIQDNHRIYSKPDRYCYLVSNELIRLCNMKSLEAQSLVFYDRLLLEKVLSTASFVRENTMKEGEFCHPDVASRWRVSLESQPDLQLMSKSPLGVFDGDVSATEDVPLPNIYPLLPVTDFPQTHQYQFSSATGLSSKFSKPHMHTIVIHNLTELGFAEFQANMYQQLYAILHAKAVEMYGAEPQDLPQPITGQCIGHDSRQFNFMFLQLNTTNLNSEQGVKNMLWSNTEPLEMYKECSHRTWRNPQYIEEYNPEVFKIFSSCWLNEQ